MEYSSIIVVGSPELARRLASLGSTQVVAFSSLEELDRWREQQKGEETLHPDVLTALDEIGCALHELPLKLRRQIEFLAEETCVPPLSALECHWGSRRSFYRMWSEHLPESPSVFLRRIRAAHAVRLIEGGLSRKEAAHIAGFTSVAQMRHSIRR